MKIIKIGTAESNDIHKGFRNDPTVSRFHCEIFIDDDNNKFITDLDSTNGTFVNGNKISEPVKLEDLDIIRAGNSLVKWKEYLMNLNIDNDLVEEDDWVKAIEWMHKNGVQLVNTSLGYSEFDNAEENHEWSDMNGRTTMITPAPCVRQEPNWPTGPTRAHP